MNCLGKPATLGLQLQAVSSLQNFRCLRLAPSWRASFHPHRLAACKQRHLPHCVPLGRNPTSQDEASPGNLILDIMKCIFRDLQSVFLFLFEQPKELKHLEFPTLRDAGRMAIFTIAVVMVLIVFLATVDSGLSFVMASVFRRIR